MSTRIVGVDFVGQSAALETISIWKDRNSFPHFLIIAGDVGSGRKTLAYHIATEMNCQISLPEDLQASTIRELVDSAYSVESKVVYLLADADKLSNAASSCLLKFTEEPPANAYIIMTLQSLENTLLTLQSRSQHLLLSPYSKEELSQLCDSEIIANIATTPGMVQTLQKMTAEQIQQLNKLTTTLVSKACEISLCNAFKSAALVKFKDSDKADLPIAVVLSALAFEVSNRISSECSVEELLLLSSWQAVLSQYKKKFARTGVSTKALYDMMLVDVRMELSRRRKQWTLLN